VIEECFQAAKNEAGLDRYGLIPVMLAEVQRISMSGDMYLPVFAAPGDQP
jgi:hypothetical protein